MLAELVERLVLLQWYNQRLGHSRQMKHLMEFSALAGKRPEKKAEAHTPL